MSVRTGHWSSMSLAALLSLGLVTPGRAHAAATVLNTPALFSGESGGNFALCTKVLNAVIGWKPIAPAD